MLPKCKRIGAALAVALPLAIGAGASAAGAQTGTCWANPSQQCSPVMNTSWIPWISTWSQGATQNWTIAKNTPVDMKCWDTGATRLGTAKWFKVKSTTYPFTTGFVPANAVSSQIGVGHC